MVDDVGLFCLVLYMSVHAHVWSLMLSLSHPIDCAVFPSLHVIYSHGCCCMDTFVWSVSVQIIVWSFMLNTYMRHDVNALTFVVNLNENTLVSL